MNASMAGRDLAQAAASLVGTPFRLHGRDPAHGLDCVGLLHASLVAIGRTPHLPIGYRLRNSSARQWFQFAVQSGFALIDGPPAEGDVLLVMPGPGQQHLELVETPHKIIHAHAGLGKVVRQALDLGSPRLAHWRLS